MNKNADTWIPAIPSYMDSYLTMDEGKLFPLYSLYSIIH